MDHNVIINRITEWLDSIEWTYNSSEGKDRLYLSLQSMQTGLTANIQIRTFDDGWYRIYAIWPDDIDTDMDMDPLIEYVANAAVSDYHYGRLKVSTEDGVIYYVSDVYINDISELTDEILGTTITGTALRIVEKYGPDIMEIINEQE